MNSNTTQIRITIEELTRDFPHIDSEANQSNWRRSPLIIKAINLADRHNQSPTRITGLPDWSLLDK